MNRKLLLQLTLTLLPIFAAAAQIKTDIAQTGNIGKVIRTNAEITQLSDQKQQIVSRLPGHIENYFVKPGSHVNKGMKVAELTSIALSKMTAEYLALKAQERAAASQRKTAEILYKKGLGSRNELGNKIVSLERIRGKRNALAASMRSLGIDPEALKAPTDRLILKAHAEGTVGRILVPLHANVDAQTPILRIVKSRGYYAVAYMKIEDALKVDDQSKATVTLMNKHFSASFIQLYPQVDEETQRAKVLFALKGETGKLLLGVFVPIQVEIAPFIKAVTLKRSALTLFQGEWVVFVPKADDQEDEHKAAEHHKEDEAEDEGHEGEEHHHDEAHEVPYAPRVVEILAYSGDRVALKGIKAGEDYVSEGVYFVKSLLLKSSLVEHGH